MATGEFDAKVDAYIAKAQPFAQPILERLRGLVHKACPAVEEGIKWRYPFFTYRRVILCHMAGFKEHCVFGFWDKEISARLREVEKISHSGVRWLERITTLKDLPPEKELLKWIRMAVDSVDAGSYKSPMAARPRPAKAEAAVPAGLEAALRKNKKAKAVFDGFSPSARREYINWIAEAKREETRDGRIATAVEWIAEGKQRNWKYQRG